MRKIGLLREGKVPPDARTPLTPEQCISVQEYFGVDIVVQPSPIRCFPDAEYTAVGLSLQEDLSDCDLLLGIKEVPIANLIAHKTYMFFSHTIKEQAYNRGLLQTILAKDIHLIDYEALKDEKNNRLIAFGYYAGVVGAHNALWAYGERTGAFTLPRMNTLRDYAVAIEVYHRMAWSPVRIVVTGGGRVGSGACRTLLDMGIRQVSPSEFLENDFAEPVFVQLHAEHYVRHKQHANRPFDKADFYAHGDHYESTFVPYTKRADIFINCIFYDRHAPRFFEVADMLQPDFRIVTIADVTCDMMPDSSVPSTIRPSTIVTPLYGFDPCNQTETQPFSPNSVDVMAIDNLPSELPRDASAFFGRQLMEKILPELLLKEKSDVIDRASVAQNGQLTETFLYLTDYVAGKPVLNYH